MGPQHDARPPSWITVFAPPDRGPACQGAEAADERHEAAGAGGVAAVGVAVVPARPGWTHVRPVRVAASGRRPGAIGQCVRGSPAPRPRPDALPRGRTGSTAGVRMCS
ncbi:hypothetical protein GCM10009834_08660 [Streptomonospora arabica]